eukprot:5367840-Alexandrium_andersonii.AAC.1
MAPAWVDGALARSGSEQAVATAAADPPTGGHFWRSCAYRPAGRQLGAAPGGAGAGPSAPSPGTGPSADDLA